MPLFFANATTAASLYVNCLSSIASILQFGLCGGTLIFVNFLLALCATPAILLLQEQHDELGEAVTGHQQNRERKKLLIACHQVLTTVLPSRRLLLPRPHADTFALSPTCADATLHSHLIRR